MLSLVLLLPLNLQPNQIAPKPVQFIDLRPETLIKIVQPQFPDLRDNYQKMLAERAQEAAQAVVEAQQAQQAPVYIAPPVAPTNDYKAFIYEHESGNNPNAINPYSGACGLGQALPCSKMGCSLGDYACQDNYFTNYMLQRYGSWEAAYEFWITNSWW